LPRSRFAAPIAHSHPGRQKNNWAGEQTHNLDRAQASAQMEALPGDQLVIVRYNQYHSSDDEWVYNLAGINREKVV
jgi:hypothetical protein